MGVFCVNTKSQEFINTSKRLNIHPDSLEVYVHLFQNSLSVNDYAEAGEDLPFPSDEQIREFFSLGNRNSGTQAIDAWIEEYGATDGFITSSEVDKAIENYGTASVHTYKNNEGKVVHKVSRPDITSFQELKYLLEKLNIIDKDYNLLGIDIDRFYERIDNLAIPADLLYSVEKQILKRIALNNDTFMKAPNGKDTNLNEDQWLTVRTRAFKEWFGDWENNPESASKVVDENGEPLEVYHGTPNKFTTFERDRNTEDEGVYGKGLYFTNWKSYAKEYGNTIMPVFLNVRNPRIVAENDFSNYGKEIVGNDGVMANLYLIDENAKEYVATNPNQIKSATGNKGTFSPENNNIYFQKSILTELKKLKQLNQPLGKAGSISKMKERLKRANLDPIIINSIIKAVEIDNSLASLTPLEIFNLITRQQEKGIAQQYNEYIQKPINEALEQHLLDFLKPFHIEALEDGVVDKYGVTGLFDILNKVIHLAKAEDRNSITVTEEVAHAIVELLGAKRSNKEENKDYTFLVDNIENTDIYKQVYEQYKDTYTKKDVNGETVPDIAKIKKEAIGQALAVAINNKWENKYEESEKSFWDKLKEWIDKIFTFFADKDYINIDTLLNKIATEVIHNDYSRFQKVDSSNYKLLDYSESIANQNKLDGGKAVEFMQFFTGIGNIITGSIAYRKQGPVYRGKLDALHDIDMVVPLSVHGIDLKSTILQQALKTRETPAAVKEFLYNTDYFKQVMDKYPKMKIFTAYSDGEGGIVCSAVYSEDESLSERFAMLSGSYADRLNTFTEEERSKMYLFDFFIENTDREEGFIEPENNIRLSSWPIIFKAKLDMGRAKDIFDYQMWDVFEQFKSQTMSPEEYLMFQKPITYNPEQQNAIDQVSDYLAEENPKEKFFLISGRAGTGKTFIINEIIKQTAQKLGRTPKVFVTAVANKAVLNLGDKIESSHGQKATASALGYRESTDDSGHKIWVPIKQGLDVQHLPIYGSDILFIDECSMLDQAKLDMILKIQAQLPGLKIVMIGDRGQIHSIKQPDYTNDILTEEDLEDTFAPSAVFTYKNKKEVQLITRVRQGEDSPVLTFADEFWDKAVNGEDLPSHIEASTVITKNGALITQHDATGTINESIIESLIPVFKKAKELGDVNYAKIVALHVEQVQRYNAAMYKAFHPEGDLVNYPVSQGDMLMFYEPYGLDEDEEGNPISKFLNSSEVVVRKVLSAPRILDVKDILTEIKRVKPSAKGLEKYENIMVQDIEVDYKGKPEKITIVCPSPDNLSTFMRLGQRLGIMGSEFYQQHNYAMMGAMKELRTRLESLAANVQFNYAISAHKSQGSTYKMVIVDYRDIRGQRLKGPKYSKSKRDTWGGFTGKGERAAIMYTALTRASNVTIAIDFNRAWDNPMPDVVSLNGLIDAHKAGEEVSDEQFDKIATQSNKAQEKKQKEAASTIQPVGAKSSNATTKTLMEEEDEKWEAIFDEHNNTISFEEDSHEYWYYPDGKEHPESRVKMDTSVTTITNPVDRSNRDIKDSNDYNKNGYGWLGTSAAIGTSADAVVRDFFMGIDITARKYPNFTIEQLKQLDKNLKNFKLYLDKKFAGTRYKVVTSPFALVGKITKSNGEVQTVGGTLDILIYDENGGYYIYDIKTSRTDLRNSTKLENYTSQVNMYREMLEAMHPELKGCCNGLGILQLSTFYATPKELYAKGKTGTTRYTVDDRKQLQADGQPIEENEEYIAPHFPENDVQKAVIKIDLDVPEQFNSDKTHKPVTVSALDIEKKFKKQETHTREDNLSQATKVSGSNRPFTGMISDEELQNVVKGTLRTKTIADRKDLIDYYSTLKVGDYLELHNKTKDQSILVRVYKPLFNNGNGYQIGIQYIDNSYAGEPIQESSEWNTSTRTVEDNLEQATRKTIDGKETILKATMNYPYEGRNREDIKSPTTMKAIVNGERTATTRFKALDTFWLHVKEGDIVEFHDNNGGSLLVRVTKNPVKLTVSTDAEEWSQKEGWSTDYFKEEVLDKYIKKGEDAYQIEYEYIDGTYVAPELQASTKFSDIIISYKKDKDNYRKGTPQKNPDTAYIFTENAQAHNKLEGKEPVGPDVFVQTHVGANRGANDRVNQADIRTGFDKKKTKNAFGLIVKKYQANGTIQFVGQEGCFNDTDEDFELFKSMNIEMFDALEASKYKKMVFPFEVALGKAALPKRFATWLKKQLEVRYGIVSTVEKNTTYGYKGYGLRVSEVKNSTPTSSKVNGENISSHGSEFAKQLTNYGNTVSVVFNGKTYRNAEHAYQTWKSGEFDEVAYNSKEAKPKGTKKVNTEVSDSIMVDILTAKLQQHPELVKGIADRGGLDYINASTHDVIGDKHWETKNGEGDNGFIKALAKAYQNITADEVSFDEDGNPETISKVNGVAVTESTGDYPQRTKENAEWSDITLDLTESDKGSGGRNELTKRVAGDKYIHFKLTDEGDNTYDADEILAAIKEAGLPTENIKLNIAGSEIGKLKSDQERYNEEVTRLLKGLQGLGVTISEIRSGGQTGIDEAGIIAAQRLGIKASIHAPKGFKFRGVDGKDVSNKQKFLARFEKKAISSELQNQVSLVFKRNPELAEIGTEEEYAEYLETIYPESVDKNVYWHGSNEDFSEGFESAKRSTGSGAPETQSRHDFYLAKQAWTVLQYVDGVNRKGVDKNGFAHWNKLFWELKEIMSNGRRENNDWKNIVIGDASLRQGIPNKKGVFNRDKGGTNGKWLSERKADYGYEDKTDKEFFEEIFGIEWNKDTFGSWIERNAEVFKALEDNQSGIYPALINVKNPIRESGENTYYEEQRGLMSKADKEGFDAILGEQTDNEFNSDVAVVLNIGESKNERDERIHFLGTTEDKKQFRDFVDKKHGRLTQNEYDRIENEKQQALLASLQQVTAETEEVPSKPLYTPYEEELIKQREALNSLTDKDAIFRPSELRDLAKSCMYLVSDFISQIQSNKGNNSERFQYLPDSPRKQELLAIDFTKMERIEICHKLGMTMYEVIRQKYFNAANNPKGSDMKRSMRKKLTLINKNWNAFLEMGQEVVARLEQVEFDNTKVQVVNGSEEEVFNGQNAEEISEIQGSTIEHWQVSFRQVSAHASLSQLIKRTLGTLFELDENGEKVISDYGVPQRINESLAVNQILMWTQGVENLQQMVERLKAQEEENPWVKQIISKLDENSEDETFKSQFWSNFKKYFQPYIIQYQKPIIGIDGKPTGETVLTNKVINQRGLEKEMIDDFMVLQQDRMAGETTMTLYNVGDEKHEAGTLNETMVKQYGEDLKKIDTYLKAIEGDSEDFNTTSVREAVRRLYGYFEIELDEDTIDSIVEDPDALSDIFTHALYIKTRKGLDRALKNKTKDFDIIEDHRNDLESLFKYVVNGAATTLESVSYEDGKLHYSYVTPSYLSNLIDRLKGNIGNEEDSEEVKEQKFQEYLENNFGKYEWFKLNGDWRNDWLEVLANDEQARKELQHAVVLTTRPMKATTSVGYRDKSPMLYAKSMIQNYFYGGDNSKWAFYRIPIMSNKPSEEYIRFIRYIDDTYKDDIADRLINVALQEIDRISTVRQRNNTKGIEKIKSFDKNGTKFLFLDYLQPILEEYQEWKKTHENEDLYYGEDENGIVSNERLLLGQMLEQRIQGTENYDNEDAFKKVLKSIIKQSMQEKFEDYLRDMRREGLLERDEAGNYIHLRDIDALNTAKESTREGKKEMVEEALENFFWNDTFAAINILQLTVTDIAYYKNAEDLQKRLAQIHAPGLRGNKDAKWKVNGKMQTITDGKTRTIYIADFDKVVSDAIENIKRVFEAKVERLKKTNPAEAKQFEEQAKHIISAFEDINVTDAQGYNSPSSYRKKAIAFGKWSDELETLYQKIRSGKYDTRDLQAMMQPLKPFVYSNASKESVGRLGTLKVGMQNKNSEYLLLMMDAILQGEENEDNPNKSKLAAIYQVMEESHYDADGNYKTDGIDTVQFNSTVKAGEMGVIDINSATTTQQAKKIIEQAIYADANNKSLGYNLDRVHVLDFDDYCIQNEVPAHLEGESIFGSQMRILSISDMPEMVGGVEQFINFRGKPGSPNMVSLRQLKQDYMQAIADNIEQSMKEIVKKFNIKGTRAERNVALSKLLQEQIKGDSRFGYDLLYSVCTDEKGNFNIPLSDPINAGRVQQLLHSIIKTRINKQMIEGGPVVQVTNFGTSKELDIVFKDAQGNRLPTLREWFAAQDFGEYNSISYEEFAVMHRYADAKEDTEEYNLYHNIYLPLRDIVSKRFKEEVANKQAGIMYIECYAPSTVFKDFADENGFVDFNKIPEEMKEIIGFRIPTEFKYSMAPLKIVGLLPSEAGEGIMLPKDITTLSGSDFDVDKLYIIRPVVRLDTWKIRKEYMKLQGKKYDNKAIWDDIYATYPEVLEEINKTQDEYYKAWLASGNTGSKEDYLEHAKSQGITKQHQWLVNSAEVFEKVMSTWDNTDDYVISEGIQMSFKEFVDSKKGNAEYYEKVINDHTKAGRDNLIFDTIYAMLTSEQAMDQIFTPGNFDEPKKYGYMAEALRVHPEMSYEEINSLYEKKGVDGLKDLIAKSKNLVYNNIHLAFHKQNMVAGKLIGIFAQNNVSHSIISLIDQSVKTDEEGNILEELPGKPKLWRPTIYIENPILEIEGEIIGGGEVSFDTLEDKKGNRISNTLAAFLAASVDAVKDPVLNFMNINETTAGILTSLVRMGYSTELSMLFLTQPIIKDVIAKYAIANEEGYKSLDQLIQETIDEINENGIDISSLDVPSLSKKSLIKTLRVATPEENINLLRALQALNGVSRVTSAIVSITKFNSVTAAAGPMLSNTMLMRQRITDNLEMDELQTESMQEALSNPIIRTFREKEFEAVDSLFRNMMLQANPQFEQIVREVQKIANGTLDDAMVNKLQDFYIAFLLARGENPIFKRSGNMSPISEDRRRYIYRQLPWKIKKLQKTSDNRFLKLIKIMPADDAHEYFWLKLNTRGMNGTVHDDVGLYWQELYQENPFIAMDLIEYNFVTSGLGFTPNSFANLIPVALKRVIPNYMQLLSNPNALLNTEEKNRLIDQFFRNNHTNNRLIKNIFKLEKGCVPVYHLSVDKSNEDIITGNKGYAEWVQYKNWLYKKQEETENSVKYVVASKDSSKIKDGTIELDSKDVTKVYEQLLLPMESTLTKKNDDTYYEYVSYGGVLFVRDGIKGDKIKYVPTSKLGGKYEEILEINPSGEVNPIDLKLKKNTKKKDTNKKKKDSKAEKLEKEGSSSLGIEIVEEDNYSKKPELSKQQQDIKTQIEYFINVIVPENERKTVKDILRRSTFAAKKDKAAPFKSLNNMLSRYAGDIYNSKLFAKYKEDLKQVLKYALDDIDKLTPSELVKRMNEIEETLININPCD